MWQCVAMISPPPFCVFKLNLLMGYFTEGGAFRFRTEVYNGGSMNNSHVRATIGTVIGDTFSSYSLKISATLLILTAASIRLRSSTSRSTGLMAMKTPVQLSLSAPKAYPPTAPSSLQNLTCLLNAPNLQPHST